MKKLKDASGKVISKSILAKEKICLNGAVQGMFIAGEDISQPVILHLHGGPGSPEMMLNKLTPNCRLEQYFTVCYWEQRGAGLSYHHDLAKESVDLQQLIDDAVLLAKILCQRFQVEKIFLMGHSWGSFLGVKIIEQYPELFHAYIGIGQISHQIESERLAYDYLLQEAKKRDEKKYIRRMEHYDKNAIDFPTEDYLAGRTALMTRYTTNKAAKSLRVVNTFFCFKEYTLKEKFYYIKGLKFSNKRLFKKVIESNLFIESTTFKIPIYILQGEHDLQVSYHLAKKYLEVIQAPEKAFYTFPLSGHSPDLEEKEKFISIVREIVAKYEK